MMTYTRVGHHDFGYIPDPWKEWGHNRPLPARGPFVMNPAKDAKLAAAMAAIKASLQKEGSGYASQRL